jgi:catechol 2,3-dioxygenase-like lactoylglutathione lyase family enzyme
VRLDQVTVGTTDVARAEDFYTRLGLRLIVRDDHYLRFECPDGDSTFSVERMDTVDPSDAVVVSFECDDLDGECERLRAAGIELDQEPTDMPWLWREARLRDPDGHRLCLFHAGENRRNPPWRISQA